MKVTEEVANALTEIAEESRKVNDLVAEIAAASGEQTQGIDQVNTAVSQLDKVTQQNAANAEESASAAEELNGQSTEMQSMVSSFTLTAGSQRPTISVSKAPANGSNGEPRHRTLATVKATVDAVQNGNGASVKAPAAVIPLDGDEDFQDF